MKNIFVTSFTLLAALAAAMPTSSPADSDATIALERLESRAVTCSVTAVDKLIFKTSIPTFQKARKAKNPSKCNWISDGCTSSPDRPSLFNFKPACQRHDFGYRNTKKQKRFTKAMKKRIDDQFKKDLYKYCSGFKGLLAFQGVRCRRFANIYYVAVRKFGRRDLGDVNEEAFTKRDEVPAEEVYEKRGDALEPVDDDFEDFDADELDPDIKGQVIPEVTDDDVEDIEAVKE